MSFRLLTLLGLASALAMAACSNAGKPEPKAVTVTRPEIEPPQPAADAAPTKGFLIWMRGKDAKPNTTVWLAPHGDGVKEIGRADGIFVADSGSVWKFVERPREVDTYTCDSILAGAPTVGGKGKVTDLLVERVRDHRQIVIAEAPPPHEAADFEHGVVVQGSIGPYLFLQEVTYDYSCGAHGGSGASFVVFDVTRGEKANLVDAAELVELDEHERPQAAETFAADALAGQTGSTLDPRLVMYRPTFDDRERLGFDYVYMTDACYACSSGEWGSYTQTATIASRRIPKALTEWEQVPRALSRWIANQSGEIVGGWSALDGSETQAGDLVATFRK